MLSKFPNKTLKVGAKVSLSPESEWVDSYPSRTNPIGITGTVTNVSSDCNSEDDDFGLKVQWDNGYWNNYRNVDYDLIAEGEPGFLEI